MKVLAYLNLHNAPNLGPLTKSRSSAVVSFLGRYAFMDFMLSNFSNSGFDRVAMLVDSFPHSISKHLGSRNTFNINTKIGSETVAYNEQGNKAGPRYNTDIANINFNDWILESNNPDYVVVAPSYYVLPLDFRPVLKSHIDKNAEITAVYHKVNNGKTEYIGRAILTTNDEGKVTNLTRNKGEDNEINIALEIYIFKVDVFKKLISEAKSISSFYSLSDMVAHAIRCGLELNTFEYTGYLRCIDSYQHYSDYSFELLNYRIRRQLFIPDWPIYTVTHDTPPAKYESSANINNAFIANGSHIAGTVNRCIISRNVTIEEGAVVEDAIIFTDAVIRKGKVIKNVIIDKKAEIVVANELSGLPDDMLYIRKGDRV